MSAGVWGTGSMRDRSPDLRIHDFQEVSPGLTGQEAIAEAMLCLQCKKPLCVDGCPVGIDIPAFVAQVAEGNFLAAYEIIWSQNMLPAICGRVCPQEVQCEGACVLANKGSPVAIGALERFVADLAREETDPKPPALAEPTGKQVAVVGSGPAGVTAAAELVRRGHSVTIFESLHEAGGVLIYGIPEFRLPKAVVRAEIEGVKDLGVTVHLNHLAGRSITPDELLGYDAVFLAMGAGLPHFMGIEGENLNGVYSANEFLTRVNLMHADRFPESDTPVMQGRRVAVVGGGNVAMDAARVARRLGAEAALIYRRREEDMPARKAETEHAKEEGVRFITCANPVKISGEQSVTGIECLRMDLQGTDESGRPVPRPVEGSNFEVDADLCIIAIGQSPNPLLARMIPGLRLGKRGTVLVDDDGRTSIPHVFAGGDISTGAATVITAMGSAKVAAVAIDRMLREQG